MNTQILLFAALWLALLSSCSKSDTSSNNTSSAGTTVGISGSLARFATIPSHLYTISNNDITTYDITDATNPVYQKKLNLGFGIETIFPKDDNLFIGTQTGMRIMDIKNPENPIQLSNFQHIRSCDPVVANDNYAFITLRSGSLCTRGVNELQIIDIKDLNNPKLIKSYPLTEPYGLALDGNNLFVCDGGIKHYDISDVKNIVFKKKTVIEATDLIANNGILMVIGKDGLYQYDYSKGDLKFLSKISTY